MSGKQQQQPLRELTVYIEETIKAIQQHPEGNINDLENVIELLGHNNVFIVQITIMALTDLFIDIAPLYKIDRNAHQEKVQKFINKDEKFVLNYELKLVDQYYKFTTSLFTFVKSLNKSQSNLLSTCYNSINKLLQSLFHFNYMKSLAQYSVYGLLDADQNQICFQTIAQLLSNKKHSLHDVKVTILGLISKILQTKPENQLPDNFIELVNYLQIDTKFLPQIIEKEEKQKRKDVKQAKREFFSQKEKDKKKQKQSKEQIAHHKKLLKEVELEKLEASADLDKKALAKNNGEILARIFYIYFKVIKASRVSKFYDVALNGILQFVHLINVDLIQNLLVYLVQSCQGLRKCNKKESLPHMLQLRLKTIYALNQILDGPAQAFDVDDKETTTQFYTCLVDCALKKIAITKQEEIMILQQLQNTFIKKRHFSQEVAGSFVKIVSNIAANSANLKFVNALLFGLKLILQKYQKTQKLTEDDNEGFGFNSYSIKTEDPSATNALNSSIFSEMKTIHDKWPKEQKIVSLISKILKNESIPQHMINKTVMDVYIN